MTTSNYTDIIGLELHKQNMLQSKLIFCRALAQNIARRFASTNQSSVLCTAGRILSRDW